MTREQLEHIIRAAADITDQYEFVVVGSQSILGPVPRPEAAFTASMEADIYPKDQPELAEMIDGAIGEGSLFHETHGYYAQGVGPQTAVLPDDWQERVQRIQNEGTRGRLALCLGLSDLFLSKAAANREKDREFCMALFEYRYVRVKQVIDLVPKMPMDAPAQRDLRARIRRWADAVRRAGHDIEAG